VVAGGAIHADWKGLKPAALKDGRDLPGEIDTRAIFKAILADHLGVGRLALEERIFPDSGSAAPVRGLIRA